MNFSPSFAVPEQMAATTPNMFIADQYGKEYDIHGDGPLTINEAIRISKLINKYVPAFTRTDNRILDGFELEKVFIEKGNLKISVNSGTGVISRNIFKLPVRTDLVWKDFSPSIPAAVSTGKILIFFEYTDLIENAQNRPLPLTAGSFAEEPHYPTTKLPKDQTLFNPIKITAVLYDPESKELIDPDSWDEESGKILITSGIGFRRLEDDTIEASYDENERTPVEINDKTYLPQNGGYGGNFVFDGGVISDGPYEPIEKLPYAVDVYYDGTVSHPAAGLYLTSTPSSFDEFYLFHNGVLLHPGEDYTIADNSRVVFTGRQIRQDDYVYAFESISGLSSGCIKSIYREKIEESGKILDIDSVGPGRDLFVFYKGLLVDPVYYEIYPGSIRFVNTLEAGEYIDIFEVIPSPSSCLEILHNDVPNTVSPHDAFVRWVDPSYCYLVFYGGKNIGENVHYTLRKNIVSFKDEFDPDSSEKLIVIRI